jgi:hypothetical protein
MKKTLLHLIVILISTNSLCQNADTENTKSRGLYFGQKIPGTVPEVFAKGIISIPEGKYCTISFSGKMDEFYIYRWNGTKAEVLSSKIDNGAWAPLQEVSFVKGYKAMEPHITYKGDMIFFIWDKPIPTGGQESPFKIWFTKKTPEGWSEPDYAGVGMFVSSDREGNIYTTDMTSIMTTGKTYLAKVKVENGKFLEYERLKIQEFYGSQAHPCIAPDGSFILFDVDSGNHLLVSFRKKDGTWDNAIDLTKHGFDVMAGGASITPDGKYLFFSCNGQLMWVDIKTIEKLRTKE